jgi:hypothetical protein
VPNILPGLKPRKSGKVCDYGLRFLGARRCLEQRLVALLSFGEEDMRGNEVSKEAFKLLKASGLNFRGKHRRTRPV